MLFFNLTDEEEAQLKISETKSEKYINFMFNRFRSSKIAHNVSL